MSKYILPMFSFRSFMVSCILFRSLNHFQFIFVYCIRECSDFADLHEAIQLSQASMVAQLVKTLPAMRKTWVRSLGWEDPLDKGTTTHSSILAWRIPWTEEPGRLQSLGLQRVRHDWATFTFIQLSQHTYQRDCLCFIVYFASFIVHELTTGLWVHFQAPCFTALCVCFLCQCLAAFDYRSSVVLSEVWKKGLYLQLHSFSSGLLCNPGFSVCIYVFEKCLQLLFNWIMCFFEI